MKRRGDNIPSVSAYAHWNEDAQRVWYEENRYDMENADEIIEDDDDYYGRDEPDPFEAVFPTLTEAKAFMAKYDIDEHRDTLSEWRGEWVVEHYSAKGQKSYKRGHA